MGAFLALILSATLVSQALVPSAGAMADKPRHHIKARGYEAGHTNHFYLEGKVSTFPKGKIKVLRNVSGGHFELYKKAKTRKTGKFLTQVYESGHRKTCFKVQVPATDVYRKTTSEVIGCITTS
jgi:hypothetical protein